MINARQEKKYPLFIRWKYESCPKEIQNEISSKIDENLILRIWRWNQMKPSYFIVALNYSVHLHVNFSGVATEETFDASEGLQNFNILKIIKITWGWTVPSLHSAELARLPELPFDSNHI